MDPFDFYSGKVGDPGGSEEWGDTSSLQCQKDGAGSHRRARRETGQ